MRVARAVGATHMPCYVCSNFRSVLHHSPATIFIVLHLREFWACCAAYAEQPSTSQQLEQSDSNAAAQPAPEGDRIVVKLRIEQQEEPIKLRIAVDAPLGRLFDKFKEMALKQGWVQAETTPKFMFDGEVLRSEDTAEGQEIEEDCIIEVHW